MQQRSLQPRATPYGTLLVAFLAAVVLQGPIFLSLLRQVHSSGLSEFEGRFQCNIPIPLVGGFTHCPVRPEITLETEKKKLQEKETPKQYVTISPPKNPTPPKKHRFLARYNSTAEKEMKRRRRDNRIVKERRTQLPFRVKPQPQRRPSKGAKAKPKMARKPRQKELAMVLPRNDDRAPTPQSEPPSKKHTKKKTKPTKRGIWLPSPDLNSQVQNHQLFRNTLPSDDYIKNVPDGPEDRLNAKFSRHWYFFERVKRRVRRRWDPATVYRQRDPYGRVHGVKDRYTVLHVTLNKKGELVGIRTLQGSGLKFLDDEARRAFRAASPFPNPSPGLVDRDGQIKFKFGFLFELTSSRFRTFWKRI